LEREKLAGPVGVPEAISARQELDKGRGRPVLALLFTPSMKVEV